MKVSDYLQKQMFSRRVHNASRGKASTFKGIAGKSQMVKPGALSLYFNQEKFMDEIHAGGHIIFDCDYRSMRPKYKWDEKEQKNKFDGFEDVSRNAVSWQEAIRGNKASTCGGNAPWIGNEGGDETAELVAKIKSHIDTANLQAALMCHFYAIFGCADGALYFYRDGDEIAWQCFSYEDGDNCTIAPDYENPEKEMGVRYFDYEGRDAVEFYRDSTIDLYVKFDKDEELLKKFPNAVASAILLNEEGTEVGRTYEKTEDGFYLVSRKSHGLDESPFCYFREKDIPSGPVQHNIEDWEKLLSDCNENVKYYAYQILFLSGGAVSLPNANFGGKVIGSKTVDGDAKILEPADASNTLDIAFKKTYNAICDGSKSVFIKPEDLKGQNDSGAYIANLYWPEIQWAKLFYGRYHKCMVKILRVFRKLVGLIEGKPAEYNSVRLSYMLTPFLPKNNLEDTQILQYSVAAGFMSKETAAEESDFTNPQEMQRLAKQREVEQQMELAKVTAQSTVTSNQDDKQ